MVLMMPKDENEGQHMVHTALEYDEGPIAVRYPRGNGLGVEMDEEMKKIPIGSWEFLRQGSDGAILTFGTTIELAMKASRELEEKGYSVAVINARFIKPLDETLLHNLMQEQIPLLTIEEAVLKGGFGSAVLEFAEEHDYRQAVVKRMGIPDSYVEHGKVDELMAEINLTKEAAVQKMEQLLPGKQKRA